MNKSKFKIGDYVCTIGEGPIIEFGVINEVWNTTPECYGIKNGKYWWSGNQLKRIDIPKIPEYFTNF